VVAQSLPSVQLLDLADASVISAFLSSVIFVIGYSLRAPWWRYQVGRAVVSLDLALGLALLPSFLRLAFHFSAADQFYDWYATLSLFLVAAVTLWRLYTIVYVQTHTGVDAAPEKEEAP
jgi:hypothetical protein